MKRTLIITGIIAAIIVIGLVVFNKLLSKKGKESTFAEVMRGTFEITVSNSGEIEAEKSVDIKGPEILSSSQGGGGGHGGMRMRNFKISDIVPEGTMVREGDYIAQLDRTEYANSLKDAKESLATLKSNYEMAILDTAVTLTQLRDAIKNQIIAVEEAEIKLAESKYEPPATIRSAEIALNKQQRALEQRRKDYDLQHAKALVNIKNKRRLYTEGAELDKNLEEFLAKFTITAPTPGIVLYKEEFNGEKRKTGSNVNPFDRIVATLPDLSSMISRTYVSEIEVNKVKIGQKVIVTIDALPKRAWSGVVSSVANIGEQLENSDAKMFEVLIRLEGNNTDLRPAMTTFNKIIINSYDNAVYIPTECVQTGSDGIPYVFKRNKTRQIVVLGEMNEKNVIVKKGLEPGTSLYIIPPEEPTKYKLVGQELLSNAE